MLVMHRMTPGIAKRGVLNLWIEMGIAVLEQGKSIPARCNCRGGLPLWDAGLFHVEEILTRATAR
jgi:hypothetical protein